MKEETLIEVAKTLVKVTIEKHTEKKLGKQNMSTFIKNNLPIGIGINDYNSISEISDKEKGVIYAMLNYPRDFINISKDYYLKQKAWDYEVFLSRFKEKVEIDTFRSDLLRNINENLK